MSRRSRRKKSGRRSRAAGTGGLGWAARVVSILVLAVILAGFGGYFWLKSYLRSDAFRVFMGDAVGAAMGSDARFELFDWRGMQAQTAGFSSENGGLVRSVRADDIQARVSLSGVRRGVWEVSDLRVKELDAVVDTRAEPAPDEDKANAGDASAPSSSGGGFLSGLLPDRAELASAEIERLNLNLQTAGGKLRATDVAARIDAGRAPGAYDVSLSGGWIETSWLGSRLELGEARGKYQDGRLFLTKSTSGVYERGVLELNGEIDGGRFGFYGALRDVRVEELVPPDWQKRITGDLSTRFTVQSGRELADGGRADTITRGELELKRGVLTSLPLLDTIAAYSNTRRFRRLDFSEAKLKYKKEGGRLELTDVVLAAEGLVRIEGRMTLAGGRVDGRFKVGITPGTLAHIPGAETKVFRRGEKGLLWSPLHISGTVDNPKEDLTDRMVAAAGERMFELVPETGKMALKFAHDSAVQLPAKAVETGADVLRKGAGAVQKGLEEGVAEGVEEGVRGIFDLIPGKSRKPRPQPRPEEPESAAGKDSGAKQ